MKHLKTYDLFEAKQDPDKRKTGSYKWYSAADFMTLIEKVNEKVPDLKWGVPSDIYGHSTQYVAFDEAKKVLEGHIKYWEGKKDTVEFSVWNIKDPRLNYVNTTRLLEQGLERLAQFAEPGKTKEASITMRNKGIKDFGDAMSRGDFGSLD